jgi:purine-binding chemotaxis protein CheW
MTGKERINDIIAQVSTEGKKQAKKSSILKEFLIISTERGLLGIQIEYMREAFELVDAKDIIPIPFTPTFILGIMNVRGEIIPVISIEQVLGIGISPPDCTKIIVIDHRFRVAFPVKDIVDLVPIDTKELKTIKDAMKAQDDQLLLQEFDYNGKSVMIVDILKMYASTYLA